MSENKQLTVPEQRKSSGWYKFARGCAAVLFNILGQVRYEGLENIPAEAPYILIGNHTSFMDPVILAVPVKQEITFLGKKELAKNKFARYVLTDMHMIMVDRHNSDMEAMRACTKALRSGEVLGIFPEGTRHHQGLMTELESGVGLIALRANVPLVPVYIQSKYKLFHRTRCIIGKPIDFSDLRAEGVNKDTCQALLERISATYAAMAADAQR